MFITHGEHAARRSRCRSRTAWRSSSSPATPSARSSRSRSKYLVPKQREANGLKAEHIEFTDDAIREIIHHYTREAGVRNLEREIATICRKVAREVVKAGDKATLDARSRRRA